MNYSTSLRVWLYCALVSLIPNVLNAASVWINEIHYDNGGADENEFIEIAGKSGTNLDGYLIELYNGANGTVYDDITLTGIIPDLKNGFGTLSFSPNDGSIQNGGADGIALGNGSNFLIQFLSYEGTHIGNGGIANGVTSIDILQHESGSTPAGNSLQLIGSGSKSSDFTWAAPSLSSFGTINDGQSFSVSASANTALLLLASLTLLRFSPMRRRTI
tara:strand:- start:1068 stop:1718 length:651 start_codon:yes stop_codon:yes gene_type:complete